MEDTLFAGVLIDECAEEMEMDGDKALVAHQLFVANHDNIKNIALQSRLSDFGIEKDLDFCLKEDEYKILPRLIGEEIGVRFKKVICNNNHRNTWITSLHIY